MPKEHKVTFPFAFPCRAAVKRFAHEVILCCPVGPDALGKFWTAWRMLSPEAFAAFLRDELLNNTELARVDDPAASRGAPPIPLSRDVWLALIDRGGHSAGQKITDAFARLLGMI